MIKLDLPTRRRIAGLGFAAVLAMAPRLAGAQEAETVIRKWPKKVQTEAKLLIERYGQPGSVDESRLTWTDNGPWRRTVLYKEGRTRSMVGGSRDHLEQTISREVPLDKVADLEKFDKRIKIDRAAGEMSACADSERLNFLALNLADDIITGQRTVMDARAFAVKVKALEKAGKSSPYLNGLNFADQESKQESSRPEAEPRESGEPETTTPDATGAPEKSGTPPVYDGMPKR
ncbi:MAG: hypothetical protein NDJ72_13735 [Elusimicrobia bacterium]|nr:hypothetical protein [Elusimicrobiota bacterium]